MTKSILSRIASSLSPFLSLWVHIYYLIVSHLFPISVVLTTLRKIQVYLILGKWKRSLTCDTEPLVSPQLAYLATELRPEHRYSYFILALLNMTPSCLPFTSNVGKLMRLTSLSYEALEAIFSQEVCDSGNCILFCWLSMKDVFSTHFIFSFIIYSK